MFERGRRISKRSEGERDFLANVVWLWMKAFRRGDAGNDEWLKCRPNFIKTKDCSRTSGYFGVFTKCKVSPRRAVECVSYAQGKNNLVIMRSGSSAWWCNERLLQRAKPNAGFKG